MGRQDAFGHYLQQNHPTRVGRGEGSLIIAPVAIDSFKFRHLHSFIINFLGLC